MSEPRAITDRDIDALRLARMVSFRAASTGLGHIRAIYEGAEPPADPYLFTKTQEGTELSPFSAYRDIWVPGSVSDSSGIMGMDPMLPREDYPLIGWELLQSTRVNEEWQTVVHHLQPGDRLALEFKADWHTSKLVRDKGLHIDVLFLKVDRSWASPPRRFKFLLSSLAGLDNSARMVRQFGCWAHGLAHGGETTDLRRYFPGHPQFEETDAESNV